MKLLITTCLIFITLGYSRAQEIYGSEDVLHDLFQTHKSVGWDLGMDYSSEPSYRIGYAMTHEERSCVVGAVRTGLAVGLSINPELNTNGIYVNDWMAMGPLNLGLKLSYEKSDRFQWMTIQPQIGLGLQRFRLFYGYNGIIFFSGSTNTPRHVLGIGYTFSFTEITK
ncbi:MAG: hypothetical protein A3D31_04815 [Candidatus Fluviicola riflensis]|nr:MAG: hypothetical protein CHH17_10205 [Candidatus Fluviicola riflensis]OGS79298.1 MAG: hypothetical protein A3D31_04815 [Candidatus Fluviicola riflensis]OGS86730.1 MAG: hypothetical protein A2724_04275 [Fluviicola sp. RIFCSPHIGHO2_01_FULL_43_53]OGS88796.1 MAG: hypothetical protein A3E30_00385 [Fluviicola sp. RIFCSPHIGHO2_12_FULL_43_24]